MKRKRLHPWFKDVSKVRTTFLMPIQMIYMTSKRLVSIGTKDLRLIRQKIACAHKNDRLICLSRDYALFTE
jgi:hypothetical protein